MDINVKLKLEGIDGLVEAVQNLAVAIGTNASASAAVISKAKAKPATKEVAETPKQEPVDTPTAESTESTTPPAETASPAETAADIASISDEDLRALAATAARKDKAKVKEIVNKYATNLTAIAADQRHLVVKELEAV